MHGARIDSWSGSTKNLAVFDDGHSWNYENLFDAKFRANTTDAILNTLTERACGLKRIRLWKYDYSKNFFECIYSYSSESAVGKNRPEINKYKPLTITAKNIYSQYTINRAPSDPYARRQHVSMFGKEDPISKHLDKDLEGSWYVVPIVDRSASNPKLLGYIAADNHCMIDDVPVDFPPSPKREAFQMYALDYVAELLVDIFRATRIKHYRDRNVRV